MILPYRDFETLDLGLIYGGTRSYKGVELVRLMKIAWDHDFLIYTNMSLEEDVFKERYIKMDSSDPDNFVSELKSIIRDRFKKRDFRPTFLGIDEFSGIRDSTDYKTAKDEKNLYKQLGKVGITTYATNQQRNQTYNRYRDNVNVVKKTSKLKKPYYKFFVVVQNDEDYEQYDIVLRDQLIDASLYWNLYDTHQVMYL